MAEKEKPAKAGKAEKPEGAAAGQKQGKAAAGKAAAKGKGDKGGKGEAQAGVLLRPVSVSQIAAAAAAGRRLPEKTTFFAPKPRTGLVFRNLAD